MDYAWIIPLAAALWLVGSAGCRFAGWFRLPRLLGGIALWLILAQFIPINQLFEPGGSIREELSAYQEDRAQKRAALEKTDVTPVALQEHDADTSRGVREIESRLDEATTSARRERWLTLVIPVAGFSFTFALIAVLRRKGFARQLPFALAGALCAAALAVVVGMMLVGWWKYDPGTGSAWRWVAGLALACAIPARSQRDYSDTTTPEFRDVFEPLLYSVAAFLVDFSRFDWVLLTVALLLCLAVKPAGAALLSRFVTHRSWPDALREGAAISHSGPLAVAAALMLYAGGDIDAPLYNALILAFLVAAVVAPLLPRLVPKPDLLAQPSPGS